MRNSRQLPFVNRPSVQPDEGSIAALRHGMQNGMVQFDDIVKYLDQRNVPPQLRQTPYAATLIGPEIPVLLIPANPNRMSWLVAGPTGLDITFSYNFPPQGMTSVPATIFMGVGIPADGSFQEGNGTVSIDDIYIFAHDTGAGNYPITVIGYEGVLAVESHLHQQTKGK